MWLAFALQYDPDIWKCRRINQYIVQQLTGQLTIHGQTSEWHHRILAAAAKHDSLFWFLVDVGSRKQFPRCLFYKCAEQKMLFGPQGIFFPLQFHMWPQVHELVSNASSSTDGSSLPFFFTAVGCNMVNSFWSLLMFQSHLTQLFRKAVWANLADNMKYESMCWNHDFVSNR